MGVAHLAHVLADKIYDVQRAELDISKERREVRGGRRWALLSEGRWRWSLPGAGGVAFSMAIGSNILCLLCPIAWRTDTGLNLNCKGVTWTSRTCCRVGARPGPWPL